jgi:hypothetical protein
MLMALPLSKDSQISAMVPAPTAWTLAEAPPAQIRNTMSMGMLVLTAHRMDEMTKRAKDAR